MSERIPKVGVGVIVISGNKVLLGRRKGSHGAGTWSFPGGRLEYGESWEDCAARELREETGLSICGAHFVAATNDVFAEAGEHYVTIFVAGTAESSVEPLVLEPDKCESWGWFDWDALPSPLFKPIVHLLEQEYDPRTGGAGQPARPTHERAQGPTSPDGVSRRA